MAHKAIKIKDPQPVPCPNCGGYYGYKYYDTPYGIYVYP
jgi:hypothetical protein